MDEKDKTGLKIRLFFVGITVVVIFSLLTSRLWTLQIVKGADYATKAKGNTWRWVSIPASRGDVVDAKGKVLATSVPQFAITLDWLDLQNTKYDAKEIVKTLAKYVQPYWGNGQVKEDIIIEDILANIQMKQFRRYEPVVVMENIPAKLQAVLAEHQQELPGISVEARPFRIYPMGSVAGQILGYVREISEGELPTFQAKAEKAGLDKNTYQAGDFVGKMGVENSYDMYLRGKDGTQVMEVDNKARPVDRLNRQDPVVGNSIRLTIDTELQKVVTDELVKVIQELKDSGKQKAGYGAAVVIEVKTGRILAMVSVPDMNPNELYGKLSPETYDRNFGRKEDGSPRLAWSRAFQEIYAPGSTFKMITGMAALQDNKVTPEEKVLDSKSSLWWAKSGIDAWSDGSKGYENIYQGLANSSNIFFQVMAQRVMSENPERLRQVAREFGLGRKSGLDIPGEEEGIAPSAEWKKALNGPRLEKQRDKDLADLQAETDVKLAQATTDKEKKKIQAAADAKKKEILLEFEGKYQFYAGWQPFDTYNAAIGQGDNKYTMLQLANYVATIVNGGIHYKPYLVDQVFETNTGKVILQNQPSELNRVSISPANLEVIKKAMRAVVTPPGTGSGLFKDVPQFTGGGKTGTAQIGSKGTAEEKDFNGTFVGFAPYDNPEIAYAGVVEYGYHGSTSSGYVAKAAFLQYFKDRGWVSTKK